MGGETLNYFLLPHHTRHNLVQLNPCYGAHLVHIWVLAGSGRKWLPGPVPGKRPQDQSCGWENRPVISPTALSDNEEDQGIAFLQPGGGISMYVRDVIPSEAIIRYLPVTLMPDDSFQRILIRTVSKNQTPQNSSAPGLI